MPRTAPPAPSAGRSRLTLKFRFRFQSQSKQSDMLDTSAILPGCRSELSTRRGRGNASLTSAPPPCGWNKLRHLRSNNGRSRVMPLRTARRSRALRGRILCLWIDDVALSVFVVMSNPRHAEGQTIFVPAFRREVEEVIRPDQNVEPTPVGGIGMEEIATGILIKEARARSFLVPKSNVVVVVGDLTLRHLFLGERHVIVAIEVVPERRHPLKAPAHAFLERFDLGQW